MSPPATPVPYTYGTTVAPSFSTRTEIPSDCWKDAQFEERILQLNPGDRLFFYTDGLTEAENPFQSEFGDDRVVQTLTDTAIVSLDDTVHSLMNDLDQWCGHGPLRDDVSVLGLEVVGRHGGGK